MSRKLVGTSTLWDQLLVNYRGWLRLFMHAGVVSGEINTTKLTARGVQSDCKQVGVVTRLLPVPTTQGGD